MNKLDTDTILNIINIIMIAIVLLSFISLYINNYKSSLKNENIEKSKKFSQYNEDINNFDNNELIIDNVSCFQFKENCSYIDNLDFAICIDKETGIEYILIINMFNNNFAICPRYNKNGSLYIN